MTLAINWASSNHGLVGRARLLPSREEAQRLGRSLALPKPIRLEANSPRNRFASKPIRRDTIRGDEFASGSLVVSCFNSFKLLKFSQPQLADVNQIGEAAFFPLKKGVLGEAY